MAQAIEKVHVIFKTHLDVGFTDYAHKVIARYFEEFIPQAIDLSQSLADESPETPFCWSLGSWLVYEFLKRAPAHQRELLEKAIVAGQIKWHALPFTFHTELMDEALFREGLTLSRELDDRFGKQTVAAKMTDVPGHTRAMIPLLAEAGVKFLHIGVNPAATVPHVPPVFIWRDEASGHELVCMYQKVYGDTMTLPGTNEAVSLVFTGDNHGPPSKQSVQQTYVELRQQFPEAEFRGATLDDIGNILWNVRATLPIVTQEIGDTWIHGTGSDPTKTNQYRELLRQRTEWQREGVVSEQMLSEFDRALLLIPEHTWGMDLKTHLQDYENYDTRSLAKMRKTERFQKFEASWQEQRDYIRQAIDTLKDTPLYDRAYDVIQKIRPQQPDLTDYTLLEKPELETPHWTVSFDLKTGAIKELIQKSANQTLADDAHQVALFSYETFSTADYARYWHQYIRDREHGEIRVWAHPDNVKPGLQVEEHRVWYPISEQFFVRSSDDRTTVIAKLTFPEASLQIGAPRTAYLQYDFSQEGSITIDLQWFEKTACRLPEAFWMSFNPIVSKPANWQIRKLGQWISPLDVVSGGGRTLHATDSGIRNKNDESRLTLQSLDAALVAPGRPSLLDFHNQLPDLENGMHFNLYNNVWGTNFTMWFEDDARFRFKIEVK